MANKDPQLPPFFVRTNQIDLDAPGLQPWTLLVGYRGAKVAVDSERLQRLLALEEGRSTASAAAAAPETDAAPPTGKLDRRPLTFKNRQIPQAKVSHASLSTRIKKIYDYSRDTQVLRHAHAGLLGEVIESFDWQIPEHPNTRLEKQLEEILGWGGVSDELKVQVQGFLKRYASVRDR